VAAPSEPLWAAWNIGRQRFHGRQRWTHSGERPRPPIAWVRISAVQSRALQKRAWARKRRSAPSRTWTSAFGSHGMLVGVDSAERRCGESNHHQEFGAIPEALGSDHESSLLLERVPPGDANAISPSAAREFKC
jgi:hypothetical protein